MKEEQEYEIVVGLEVHVQLLTKSKLFCGDSTAFGAEPNTAVSPITLGHPGTLPKINKEAISFAIKMGLACNATIATSNYFARKHYFYPDLPKGYQVSQHTTPICMGGFILISNEEGEKKIRLNRIHLEEDAGKSIHDADAVYTNIDLNRAGTPLIEIVTEPEISNGDEAVSFLNTIRRSVRYLGISDGNMEEGSLRCDANISVRKKGESKLGTKVEVKNLNSIRFVKKAIESEAARMIDQINKGEKIIQQTRSFDPAGGGTTFAIRDKEEADDYRYFPEPDLTPFQLEEVFIESIRRSIPQLPDERTRNYTSGLQLTAYDAGVITDEKNFSDYFDKVIASLRSNTGNEHLTTKYKAAANWMLGPVRSWLNEKHATIDEFPLLPARMAELINMVDAGKISFSTASTRLFDLMIKDEGDPAILAEQHHLLQESDASLIEPIIEAVLEHWPQKVAEYRKGKKGLLSLFVGEVMKRSKGKADPGMVNKILLEKLK